MAFQRRQCVLYVLDKLKEGPMTERELHSFVLRGYGYTFKQFLKILGELHNSLLIQWDKQNQVVNLVIK